MTQRLPPRATSSVETTSDDVVAELLEQALDVSAGVGLSYFTASACAVRSGCWVWARVLAHDQRRVSRSVGRSCPPALAFDIIKSRCHVSRHSGL